MRIGLDITNDHILAVVIKTKRQGFQVLEQKRQRFDPQLPGDLLVKLRSLRSKLCTKAKQSIIAVAREDVLQKELSFDTDLKPKQVIQFVEQNISQLLNNTMANFYFDVVLTKPGEMQNTWRLYAIEQVKLQTRSQLIKHAGFTVKAIDVDYLAHQRGKKHQASISDADFITALGLATWESGDAR